MSLQMVPLSSAPNQSFNVQLNVDNKPLFLNVAVRYNEMASYWAMTIFNANGKILVDSVPLLTGAFPAANLLEQQKYLNIGSWYIVNVSNFVINAGEFIGYGEGEYGFGPYGGNLHNTIDWPLSNNLGLDFQLWVDDTPPV